MTKLTSKHLITLIITLLYIAALFYMSLQPLDRVRHIADSEAIRNLLHIPAYGMLAVLMLLLFKDIFSYFLANLMVPVIGVGVALADEHLQSFAAGRMVTQQDLMLDVIGIAGGLVLFFLIRKTVQAVRQCP